MESMTIKDLFYRWYIGVYTISIFPYLSLSGFVKHRFNDLYGYKCFSAPIRFFSENLAQTVQIGERASLLVDLDGQFGGREGERFGGFADVKVNTRVWGALNHQTCFGAKCFCLRKA